jgi:hypothetical protein
MTTSGTDPAVQPPGGRRFAPAIPSGGFRPKIPSAGSGDAYMYDNEKQPMYAEERKASLPRTASQQIDDLLAGPRSTPGSGSQRSGRGSGRPRDDLVLGRGGAARSRSRRTTGGGTASDRNKASQCCTCAAVPITRPHIFVPKQCIGVGKFECVRCLRSDTRLKCGCLQAGVQN